MRLAIPGGNTIILMTRMQHGTGSTVGKIFVATVGGFRLAGLQLFHSIPDSLIISGSVHAGTPIGYLDSLGWFGYTFAFIMLGSLLLVTALRPLCNKELIAMRRNHPEERQAGQR